MSKRIGIFVDISNLYYCVDKRFEGRKLDYKKYWEFIKDLGEIDYAVAYGVQVDDEAKGFITCLKHIGFQPKYKSPKTFTSKINFRRNTNNDVTIAVDMLTMIEKLDLMILGTADSDLVPAVVNVQSHGVSVITLACGISKDLKDVSAQWIEIPESLLETRNQ